MAYLAKELNSWAAASWTVGLSSALLLGTTIGETKAARSRGSGRVIGLHHDEPARGSEHYVNPGIHRFSKDLLGFY